MYSAEFCNKLHSVYVVWTSTIGMDICQVHALAWALSAFVHQI